MKKILLTGASGYIGSHLMNKLKDNYEIIAISRNIENKSNEQNINKNYDTPKRTLEKKKDNN